MLWLARVYAYVESKSTGDSCESKTVVEFVDTSGDSCEETSTHDPESPRGIVTCNPISPGRQFCLRMDSCFMDTVPIPDDFLDPPTAAELEALRVKRVAEQPRRDEEARIAEEDRIAKEKREHLLTERTRYCKRFAKSGGRSFFLHLRVLGRHHEGCQERGRRDQDPGGFQSPRMGRRATFRHRRGHRDGRPPDDPDGHRPEGGPRGAS